MATKTHRGKTIAKVPGRHRGECPICKATGIKLMYEVILADENGSKVKTCKRCRNKKPASV